jgi:hypothetical protein
MRRCADQSKYRRSVVTIATYLSVDYPAGVQAKSLERRSGLERFGDGFVLRTFVKQLGCNSAYLFPTIEFFDQLRYEMLDVNHRTS